MNAHASTMKEVWRSYGGAMDAIPGNSRYRQVSSLCTNAFNEDPCSDLNIGPDKLRLFAAGNRMGTAMPGRKIPVGGTPTGR